MWVEGEMSNLARPASGHLYFSLKDERAQIRCALFRGASRGGSFMPANGMQVLARGRVSLYEPRGDYQLIVDHLEAAGEGLLRRRLEELKQKLAAAGLFDAARKRPLPALPGAIGVITSPSGAAVRDILHILKRRFPAMPGDHLPRPGAGRAGQVRYRQGLRNGGATGRVRRTDPGTRRRLARGPVGLQRRDSSRRPSPTLRSR
jgi:exodeoxyribonuclease VII large subunit